MASVYSPSEQRFVLPGTTRRTYERLLRAFADRPGVRLTYDRGTLELMTLSHEHESYGYLLARLVDALTEELGLPVKGGGSSTFRRRKRRRGLEPHASWWIASELQVRGKTEIDLRHDPPPDLCLEIDVTHSSSTGCPSMPRSAFPKSGGWKGKRCFVTSSAATAAMHSAPLAGPLRSWPRPTCLSLSPTADSWTKSQSSAASGSGCASNSPAELPPLLRD
jgi:hypothetical protein